MLTGLGMRYQPGWEVKMEIGSICPMVPINLLDFVFDCIQPTVPSESKSRRPLRNQPWTSIPDMPRPKLALNRMPPPAARLFFSTDTQSPQRGELAA
jgi:hypothetical protein